MREHRAAGRFAERPYAGRGGRQPLVHDDEAGGIDGDTGLLQPDLRGLRDAAGRDQDVRAFERVFAAVLREAERDRFAGAAGHAGDPGIEMDGDAFVAEQRQHRRRHVRILARGELRAALDDGDGAAEAPECLRHFQPDIAAAEDDQMRGQAFQTQRFHVRERRRCAQTPAGPARTRLCPD